MHTPQRNGGSTGHVPGVSNNFFRGRGRGHVPGRGHGRGRGRGRGRGWGRGRGQSRPYGRSRGSYYGNSAFRRGYSNDTSGSLPSVRVESGFSFFKKSFLEDPWLQSSSSQVDETNNSEQMPLRGIDTLQGATTEEQSCNAASPLVQTSNLTPIAEPSSPAPQATNASAEQTSHDPMDSAER